jgi:hypothetical protein
VSLVRRVWDAFGTRLVVLGTYGNVSFSLNFSNLSATSVMRVIDVAITDCD